jgi:hypothetical protein
LDDGSGKKNYPGTIDRGFTVFPDNFTNTITPMKELGFYGCQSTTVASVLITIYSEIDKYINSYFF